MNKHPESAVDSRALTQPQEQEARWAVGLMTGTVLDGNIDVALIKTDGQRVCDFGHYTLAPYRKSTVDLLRTTLKQAFEWQFEGPEPDLFAEAEHALSEEQSDAVAALINDAGLSLQNIGAIGFHGQTVLHRPPSKGVLGQTRQLGDGELMARKLGVTVVNDFRRADMQAGGHGAPLCGIYHRALLESLDCRGETAVLNLGGIANLTWWDGDEQLVAFDTGPANAPINDFIRKHGLGDMDFDGAIAAQGVVNESLLETQLLHSYFSEPYPKSLDRFDFDFQMASELTVPDGAALLTAFSAAAVGKALDLLPQRPKRLIVCGGGRRNPSLMAALSRRAGVQIEPAEAVGWRGDAIEAECFGFLAMRVLANLPVSFPSTTGVSVPTRGGVIHRPATL